MSDPKPDTRYNRNFAPEGTKHRPMDWGVAGLKASGILGPTMSLDEYLNNPDTAYTNKGLMIQLFRKELADAGETIDRNTFGHCSIEGQVFDREENPHPPQPPTKMRRERNFDKTHYNGREEKLGLGLNHMTPDNTTDHGI